MRFLIEHETYLKIAEPVREHHCELRLSPQQDVFQKILKLDISVKPDSELSSYLDCFGNRVHHCNVIETHEDITIQINAEVETLLENPFDFVPIPPSQEKQWISNALSKTPQLWDFLVHRSPATPDLRQLKTELAFPQYDSNRPLMEHIQEAMNWISDHFQYDAGATHVHSSLEEFLQQKAGVCQDFSHLLVSLIRSWGFPARYMMGYQDPGIANENSKHQATHAWTEILIPGAGWRGFDATNGLLADASFIRVAAGRDYKDAAPQRGSFKGDAGSETPEVKVKVVRLE